MISFIDIPTEQTTAATDFILFLLSVWTAMRIVKAGKSDFPVKATIWIWVFVLLAIAAFFGSVAHGFKMDEQTNFVLWQPLNLSLGLAVSLFAVGAIYDLNKSNLPKMVVPAFTALGIIFYFITVFIPGSFLVFIIYEALVMLFALVAYIILATKKKLHGGWWMVGGVFITIIAAVIQATEAIHFKLIWEFDFNGTFHIVQMLGIIVLLNGLLIDFKNRPNPEPDLER